MALRDQPYFPMYVQDFMTDEKLLECCAESIGVYIMIMCVMHKSKEYGTILLRQKDKQNEQQINNFALKLVKHLPFDLETTKKAISELVDEEVLIIEDDYLIQSRMVKDNDISIKRSLAGRKGGDKTKFALAKLKAKEVANSEYANEDVIENNNKGVKEIILPWNTPTFINAWENWKEYKLVEHKFKFASKQSQQASLTAMANEFGTEEACIKSIAYTMSKGWKGLREAPKNDITKDPQAIRQFFKDSTVFK